MEIQKTTGIVLASKPSGEADILCTVYSQDYGKRRFIFKGLQKSKKRPRAAAEPGSVLVLQFYYHEEKNTSIVNDFTILKECREIRKDLLKIYHLFFILETIDQTTGLNDSVTPFYPILLAGIETLSTTPFPVNLTAFFLLHILRLHGIFIMTSGCSRCGSQEYMNFSLSPADLKPICGNCSPDNHLLSLRTKNFMQEALTTKFHLMNHEQYNARDILDLIYHLALFIENYFHIHLKSKEFILSWQNP
jgi:DNA repair protein RecO (recombination protein O)